MKKRNKFITVLVILVMMSFMVIACSSESESGSKSEPSSQPSNQKESSAPSAPKDSATTYPIKTDETLSYWTEIVANLVGVKSSLDEVPFFQEWQKRTGVKMKFTSPVANQAKEGLNVMLASGDLPDMIEYNWLDFPGGPEKAISDGYILKLNDLIDQHAPNLKKYLEENPDVDKMVKTDNGNYFAFPFIRGDDTLKVYQGPIIRQDWLDELGLKAPTTIDEWHTVLTAFKEKKGASAPLSFLSAPNPLQMLYNGAFIGAFGTHRMFYIDNGEVKFGPAQPQYKDFLATFSKWYAEGLLDKNIATVDGKTLDANITSGLTGATVHNAGGGIGKWMPLLTANVPNAILAPVPYPVLKAGDTPKFGQQDFAFVAGGMVAISGKSKNAELAVKLLDYGYSEEGHMFFNFGTEGVSYKMVGDYPTYTDLLMNNPDKLAPAQAMSLYIRGNYNGPFVQDKRYIQQYYANPQQKKAIGTWQTDNAKYGMPPISATPEESLELAKIMTDVNTLIDEMTLKVILGSESVDNFDKYMDKLKSLNLDRAIEIQKAALDRYNKR